MSVILLESIESSASGLVGVTQEVGRVPIKNLIPRALNLPIGHCFKREELLRAIDYHENGLNAHSQEALILLGETELVMAGGQYQSKVIPYISCRRNL